MRFFKNFILQFRCKSCKKQSTLPIITVTRSDLESSLGSNFQVNCEHCAIRKEYHVNDVRAIANANYQVVILLTVIAIILAGILLLLGIGIISTLTLTIPLGFFLIYQQSVDRSVTLFNKNILPRDRNYVPKNKKII